MMNFLLGMVAGGLIACVATIAAARHPEVQARLGLRPAPVPAVSMPAALPRPESCPPRAGDPPVVGNAEMLFSKRRFWSVTPR
ncbi:hypothetical protein [Methylobacterium soli]|uniref:Uncharacterized protein n=1 Tax=Methylobacterium soli TaxID=553447 RepID=A0A6L3T874_9HYPH|nr:hypothetical protein [Methylobacterium soli]KAB1081781.1 hypothetical protein F6X53_01405 [Methylobacterium soli]GJE43518.1 hypothetical protein AEGHOMDF_2697 [Methylobacterium soli]